MKKLFRKIQIKKTETNVTEVINEKVGSKRKKNDNVFVKYRIENEYYDNLDEQSTEKANLNFDIKLPEQSLNNYFSNLEKLDDVQDTTRTHQKNKESEIKDRSESVENEFVSMDDNKIISLSDTNEEQIEIDESLMQEMNVTPLNKNDNHEPQNNVVFELIEKIDAMVIDDIEEENIITQEKNGHELNNSSTESAGNELNKESNKESDKESDKEIGYEADNEADNQIIDKMEIDFDEMKIDVEIDIDAEIKESVNTNQSNLDDLDVNKDKNQYNKQGKLAATMGVFKENKDNKSTPLSPIELNKSFFYN